MQFIVWTSYGIWYIPGIIACMNYVLSGAKDYRRNKSNIRQPTFATIYIGIRRNFPNPNVFSSTNAGTIWVTTLFT